MTLLCRHCETEIKYNADLQRYDHVGSGYDGCQPRKGASFFGPDAGKRAEPA